MHPTPTPLYATGGHDTAIAGHSTGDIEKLAASTLPYLSPLQTTEAKNKSPTSAKAL